MNISNITTLWDIEKFLKSSVDWELKPCDKKETYEWMRNFLSKIRYRKLRKKEKKLVKIFLRKATNYSEIQIKRLIQKHREGTLFWKPWQKNFFAAIYDENDIALLHKVDSVHRLAGPATKKICERYLKIVLEELIIICPFIIINFHSDNGSEYINKVVANILNKLHIGQTKSRPRKHNDNALVETKNGSIIRKTFGYFHIPATEKNAALLNEFCKKWLITYLNFHRPCGFATTKIDRRGKEKKIYKHDKYTTPYEKLKSLPNADQYLKRHIFFENLDAIAYQKSDTEFGLKINEEKAKMFMKLDLFPQKTLTA